MGKTRRLTAPGGPPCASSPSEKNDAGQRLDRFLGKSLPLLPPALLQKYIRIKRVKCNGQRCQRDQRLREGDVLQLYINDEFFDQPREDNLFLTLFQPRLNIPL